MKRTVAAFVSLLALSVAACGSDTTSSKSTEPAAAPGATSAPTESVATAPDGPSGSITVLTNRTDLVDTVFQDYAKTFGAKYPNISVKFEAITDYEGEVRIRMNTTDYGDVLLIPRSVSPDQFGDFFEPLGATADLSKTYRFTTEAAFGDQTYGLAVTGNATGFVYNKKVWAAAGITALPTTPDEFLADLKAIKDTTEAVPYYTNYKDGWPLTQWESMRGLISADADYANKMSESDAPWTAGDDHFVMDKLLYDIVASGYSEDDPTTTDWETSKGLIGSGEVATMNLGSWSIVQMQEAATDPADIGYMPFPTQVDGKFYTAVSGDYKIAINKNSSNKEAARAWLDWFTNESNFAFDQGGIPPLLTGANPPQLQDFIDADVVFIEQNPAPADKAGLLENIDKEAEINLFDGKYRQRIIDAAKGNSGESLDDIFADLNSRWAAARAKVAQG
jgi:raffinose/stachyose/melibiose transport system substrate-binding protein